MQDADMAFEFPARSDPIEGIDLQPPRFDGEARDDRDAITILLCAGLRDARGLHAETMLTAVGALVGRAAAVAVAARAEEQGLPPMAVFSEAGTASGGRFLFSDAVNQLLFDVVEDWTDLWALLSGMATALGQPVDEEAPREWARHFAASVGGPAEGEPLLTDGQHPSTISAFDAVRRFWPAVERLLETGGGDRFDQYARLMMLAAAVMAAFVQTVPADAAASHVMQAAIAAAKLPLDKDAPSLFDIVPLLPAPGGEADLSRIADPHYPYAPAWTDAPIEDSTITAVMQSIEGGTAATVQSVERAPAPFWFGRGTLWRGRVTSGAGRSGRLYVLQVEQEVFLLAFAGGDLVEITASRPPVIETAEIAADWFRFRFAFSGPFTGRARLMETREALCLLEPLDDAAAAKVEPS